MNTPIINAPANAQPRQQATSGRVTWEVYESPFGPLTLIAGRAGLQSLHFPGRAPDLSRADREPAVFTDAIEQLRQYFDGERQRFEIELDLTGTPFQRGVWQQLLQIPYGTTVSYTALARSVGRLDRIRAVAAAVGQTPVPIIVPCHRVVAADGGLTGYVGGLQRKAALLDLEAQATAGLPYLPGSAFRQIALL
jgi:methylated-DNA-[protein]-cysteine S-methyltransferase